MMSAESNQPLLQTPGELLAGAVFFLILLAVPVLLFCFASSKTNDQYVAIASICLWAGGIGLIYVLIRGCRMLLSRVRSRSAHSAIDGRSWLIESGNGPAQKADSAGLVRYGTAGVATATWTAGGTVPEYLTIFGRIACHRCGTRLRFEIDASSGYDTPGLGLSCPECLSEMSIANWPRAEGPRKVLYVTIGSHARPSSSPPAFPKVELDGVKPNNESSGVPRIAVERMAKGSEELPDMQIDATTRGQVFRGGADEPYCSEACYNGAGRALALGQLPPEAVVRFAGGNKCAMCGKTVKPAFDSGHQ
jgi:hypothetical protein